MTLDALDPNVSDSLSSFLTKPAQAPSSQVWRDWKWQQRNCLKTVEALAAEINDLPVETIRRHASNRKIQVTPYYVDLIRRQDDPDVARRLLNQVIPFWAEEREDGYNGETENWELSEEMKTPICQHKYDNRVILRIANVCNAYCQFCFEALRTINTEASKPAFSRDHWAATCDYIAGTPAIEEVIFSGGEPLMLNDDKLRRCLADIHAIRPELLIRVHSRALTFNPFRVTDALLDSLREARVTAFGVHLCHPAEITRDFEHAVERLRTAVPITFANMPVLKGINDDYDTLCALFFGLYRTGVVPYYLYHFMPYSPGSAAYRARVSDIVAIMRRIKRRKSNIAVPEYVLPHVRGKFTVPLILDPDEYPAFESRSDGTRHYRFTNWQGEEHAWSDA